MNAPPFPINPDVGQWFGNWVWNGARWVASPTTGLRVVAQTFLQSGAYMPSPGLVSLTVECFGGGGGGGGTQTDSVQYIVAGGGGGSGGYSRKTLPAALVRGGILVTVGAGGAAGQNDGDGGDGGVTSFGAFCVANGGHGGGAAPPSGEPGLGGAVGIGDVAFGGATGQVGSINVLPAGATLTIAAAGGLGGAIMGGSHNTAVGPGTGTGSASAADNSGAGGSGGVLNQVAPPYQAGGGDGGSGVCIVTEYCWGDRNQALSEWRPPLDVNVSFPKPPWPGGQPGPWPGGGPWPPGAWWPPGWSPDPSWPPGWGPWPRGTLPQGQEFEAGAEPFGQDEDPEAP